jgi:hypothetical protein
MGLFFGTKKTEPETVNFGTKNLKEVYWGSTKLWPSWDDSDVFEFTCYSSQSNILYIRNSKTHTWSIYIDGTYQSTLDYTKETFSFTLSGTRKITIRPKSGDYYGWLNNIWIDADNYFAINVNCKITPRMFCKNSGEAGNYCCDNMFFQDEQLTLGSNFGFSSEWDNVTKVGDRFLRNMFAQSGITTIPSSFNIPKNIETVGSYFLQSTFGTCKKLATIHNSFKFPLLNITGYAYQFNNTFALHPTGAPSISGTTATNIINGNPVPAQDAGTFHVGFSDYNSISSNWRV